MGLFDRISGAKSRVTDFFKVAFDDGGDELEAQQSDSGGEMVVPTNPARAIRIGLITVLITFGGFGTWAATAQISSAIIANGQVQVFSSRKKVEHLEGGIITEVLVSNGDKVKEGDVLVRLDPTRAKADMGRVQGQYDQTRATVARLIAERDGLDEIEFPSDILARKNESSMAEIIKGQTSLFKARRQSSEGQLSLVQEQIVQLNEQIRGLEAQRRARREQIATIEQELKDKRYLYEKGLAPRAEVLERERLRSQYNGDIGDLTARIANMKARIGEAELQILQIKKTLQEEVETELRQRQTEAYDLAETYDKVNFTMEQTEIRAPHAGVVVNKQVSSSGQVIRPGGLIMELVPEDETLIIEALVSPVDIDNVSIGLTADVEITAFKARNMKKMSGEVIYVSADSLLDERTGLYHYKARISVPEEELEKLIDDQRLQPGMQAVVFIKTGSRTPLAYLLQPLNDSISHAWRET